MGRDERRGFEYRIDALMGWIISSLEKKSGRDILCTNSLVSPAKYITSHLSSP